MRLRVWIVIVALVILAIAGRGFAAGIDVTRQGNVELGISGHLDMDADEKNSGSVDFQLGYFLLRGVEFGGWFLFGRMPDSAVRDASGVFVEYGFDETLGVLPFVGTSMRYAKVSAEDVEADSTKLIGVYVGNNFVVTSGVAMFLKLSYLMSDEAVFGAEGSRAKTDMHLSIGYRVFF